MTPERARLVVEELLGFASFVIIDRMPHDLPERDVVLVRSRTNLSQRISENTGLGEMMPRSRSKWQQQKHQRPRTARASSG